VAQSPPPSARRYSLESALLARQAADVASTAVNQGQPLAVAAGVVASYQAAAAVQAQNAVAQMLAEQAIDEAADALLNVLAFTTPPDAFVGMVEAIQDRRDTRFAVVDAEIA
jgi:hypothetical protein